MSGTATDSTFTLGSPEGCDVLLDTYPEGTASYYAADGKLRVVDQRNRRYVGELQAYEEYRYDALGRRILRRSRSRTEVCSDASDCWKTSIQRFVWDGHAILNEIRYPGGDSIPEADLERDTVTIQEHSRAWGRVLYTHGLGLDQPLAVTKVGHGIMSGGSNYDTGPTYLGWDPLAFAPHWDWRGTGYTQAFYGPTAACKPPGTDPNKCVRVNWPQAGVYYLGYVGGPNADWYGSVLDGQRDQTGHMYRRNRYYDPQTGRFTQEDPIGLAGGLNLYGFAEGDPVNFADPFGLQGCKGASYTTSDGSVKCDDPIEPLGTVNKVAEIGAVVTGLWGLGRALLARLLARGASRAAAAEAAAGTGGAAFSATSAAGEIASATGGTVSQLARGEGAKITIEGARNIVVRIKASGEFRVSIAGLGSLTREGVISANRALTHLTATSAHEILEVTRKAMELVRVAH